MMASTNFRVTESTDNKVNNHCLTCQTLPVLLQKRVSSSSQDSHFSPLLGTLNGRKDRSSYYQIQYVKREQNYHPNGALLQGHICKVSLRRQRTYRCGTKHKCNDVTQAASSAVIPEGRVTTFLCSHSRITMNKIVLRVYALLSKNEGMLSDIFTCK